jgi:hypothetical protein
MKTQRHFWFKNDIARMEAEQIRTVLVDLDCTVQLLDCQIAAEELKTQQFDPSNPAYPKHAKSLAARRDNLNVTIVALEKKLGLIRGGGTDRSDSGLTVKKRVHGHAVA